MKTKAPYMENYSFFAKFLVVFGIMGGYSSGNAFSPVLQDIIMAFPEASPALVRSLSTMGSLFSCSLGLVVGGLLGKKLKYKTVLITATLLCLVGGVMPGYLNDTFFEVFLGRLIFSVGSGIFATRMAIVRASFSPKETGKWLGLAMTCQNILGLAVTLAAGYAASLGGWKAAMKMGWIAAVPLVIVLFLYQEPPKQELEAPAKEDQPKVKGKFNFKVLWYMALYCVAGLSLYPFLLGISTFVAEQGLGSAAEASWCTSAYLLGLSLTGTVFGKLEQKLARFGLSIGCIIVTIGYLVTLFAPNVFLCMIGAVMCGGGFCVVLLFVNKWVGDMAGKGMETFTTTLNDGLFALACFGSAFWMTLVNTAASGLTMFPTECEKTFFVGAIIYLAIALLGVVKDLRPKINA